MKKAISAALALLMALSAGVTASARRGGIVSPSENEWNTVTVEKDGDPLVKLTFMADDDPEDFFFNVVTKMDSCVLADAFDEMDAFYFDVKAVGDNGIPATSVPTLALYNPFVDEDGEPAVPMKNLKIYQVKSDYLVDVSKDFTARKDSDGRYCFVIGTRKPGAYVIAEKKVDDSYLKAPERKKAVKKLPAAR